MRLRIRLGDVFTIPVDDGFVGIGQILAQYKVKGWYFIVVHGVLQPTEGVDIDAALASPVVLAALTLDALLWHGRWKVIGSAPVDDAEASLPAYQIAQGWPPRTVVEDFSARRTRLATPQEAATLPVRTTVAPIRVEKALRALHGREQWVPAYDELRPTLRSTRDLFG